MLDITTTEQLDPETLLALVQQTDPLGVLSIYVDAQPGGPGARSRGAAIDIGNRLAELESRIRSDGPPERAVAVSDRLERLAPEIERLVDPRESGRGRVLFVPLSEGRLTRFSSRLSVANRVVLDSSAFIHPLLELLDEGRPTGVVVASRSEGNLLEWRLGELRSLRRLTPDAPEASHERSGPVAPNPGGAHTTPRREQRQARERHQLRRFVREMAAVASQQAGERGWERVLVSGGETLTEPLAQAMPRTLRTVRDPRMLAQLDPSELVRAVTGRLRSEHHEHELRLVDSMRETAHGGGAAALGLSEVSAALNEGRVLHLAYDPVVRYEGSVDSDGMLYAEGEAPPAADGLLHEPRLTERLVERGLETGARLTPVEGASLAALAEAGGIGAWLRW
jgi:riboflavin biosynthesis pyrimidine reductase